MANFPQQNLWFGWGSKPVAPGEATGATVRILPVDKEGDSQDAVQLLLICY
jgi:hypothetical protein